MGRATAILWPNCNFAWPMLGIHISRMAEDLVIYSTAEFGFVTLADTIDWQQFDAAKEKPRFDGTGQGQNRAADGQPDGDFDPAQGLPMTYDKADTRKTRSRCLIRYTIAITLPVCAAVIATLRVNEDKMKAALDPAMLSTDVAQYLVRRGVPFREAHHMAGRAGGPAQGKAIPMSELSQGDWRSISPRYTFGDDIREVFNFAQSVKSRAGGGTGEVKGQIKRAQKALAKNLKGEG